MKPVVPIFPDADVAKHLVAWYRQGHRALPWRQNPNAYHVWLSEVMLQQTQVATVLPYYDRFLKQFPTIVDLANAPIDSVLKAWEGLGYYARARNLHRAAQTINNQYHGHFPNTFKQVHSLPGIGESTAGAILTFAFKQPHPILDGNVKRVLSRLCNIANPIDEKQTIAALWQVSAGLLPKEAADAYDFNQALMELGATLCIQRAPHCGRCPWQSHCKAYAAGTQNQLPVKKPAKAVPHYTIGIGVVYRHDKVLIALRPAEGLLGGLWEFPGGKCQTDEGLKDCVKRELLEETGLTVSVGAKIAQVKHAYTHFKITLHAFHCEYLSGEAQPKASQALKWVRIDELNHYAFPKANKTVLSIIQSQAPQQLTLC